MVCFNAVLLETGKKESGIFSFLPVMYGIAMDLLYFVSRSVGRNYMTGVYEDT